MFNRPSEIRQIYAYWGKKHTESLSFAETERVTVEIFISAARLQEEQERQAYKPSAHHRVNCSSAQRQDRCILYVLSTMTFQVQTNVTTAQQRQSKQYMNRKTKGMKTFTLRLVTLCAQFGNGALSERYTQIMHFSSKRLQMKIRK